MIRLTRLNQVPLVVNSDLIEHVEITPDTVIALTTGQKILVRETADEVIERVVRFRRAVLAGLAASQALVTPRVLGLSPGGRNTRLWKRSGMAKNSALGILRAFLRKNRLGTFAGILLAVSRYSRRAASRRRQSRRCAAIHRRDDCGRGHGRGGHGNHSSALLLAALRRIKDVLWDTTPSTAR